MQTVLQNVQKCVIVTSMIVLLTVTSYGTCDVFTSSNKILQLADSEASMLDALNAYIYDQYDHLKSLSEFLSERSKAVHLAPRQSHHVDAGHPNGAYFLIKRFNRQWTQLTQTDPGLTTHMKRRNLSVPSDTDHTGSLSSLIRLQRVYNLDPLDMYHGNYSGHLGPPLEPEDAFLLGRQAFMDGFLDESMQWLEMAVNLLKPKVASQPKAASQPEAASQPASSSGVMLSRAASLLGRAYFFNKHETKARELFNLSKDLEPNGGDVIQLKKELEGKEKPSYGHSQVPNWHHNMSRLCSRDKHIRMEKTQPWHVCRYKAALGLPYLRFKEEILSLSPAASVFYNVVHHGEIEEIKDFIKGKLFRGRVGQGKEAVTAKTRTSDLGWIHDDDLQMTRIVSQRVKVITGLEVDQRRPDGPSSSEAMQVVNYGLGGHYDAHFDPFEKNTGLDPLLLDAGSRIATFLIYLTDVEKGGSTVFVDADISVAPIKGMALFWYNFKPDMNGRDEMTRHAGCPVLVGQKWIANKWIWTYGNTFRRPCGPEQNSTQQDLEKLGLMKNI